MEEATSHAVPVPFLRFRVAASLSGYLFGIDRWNNVASVNDVPSRMNTKA